MNAKPLTVILTVITVFAWFLCALIATQAASLPLLGLLPLSIWTFALSSVWPLVVIGMIYLIPPLIAWKTESKLWAWTIPALPLIGALSFAIQFMIGMSAFN
jgi:hypothetical protein